MDLSHFHFLGLGIEAWATLVSALFGALALWFMLRPKPQHHIHTVASHTHDQVCGAQAARPESKSSEMADRAQMVGLAAASMAAPVVIDRFGDAVVDAMVKRSSHLDAQVAGDLAITSNMDTLDPDLAASGSDGSESSDDGGIVETISNIIT